MPRPRDPKAPRWFEEGSWFQSRLGAALREGGVTVASAEQVAWSGANALLDRDAAARLLAERLDALHAAHPRRHRLVIGHSHGGNVCLRAFAHLTRPADGIRVVTIATPFVEVVEGREDRSPSLLLAWVAVTAVVIWALNGLLGRTAIPFAVLLMWAGLIGAAVGLPVAILAARRLRGITRRLADASSQVAYRAARAPTLVLRGYDDEASLTLGFGALATRLSHLSTATALNLAELLRTLFGLLFIGAGLIGVVAAFGIRFRDALLADALALANAWGPAVAVVVGGVALLEGMAPAVFGRELFLTYLNVAVNSNSAPDAGDHVRIATLLAGADDAGLRHALYAHPGCARAIRAWYGALEASDASTRPVATL